MKLNGIGALVAGGASGLGEATARELASRGARVAIADLNEERGDGARGGDRRAPLAKADVTARRRRPWRPPWRRRGAAASRCPAPGSAGPSARSRRTDLHALRPFETVVRVNLIGTFNVLRLAAGAMAGERARRARASAARW